MYRILIIEDDRTIANVLAEHLRTWDYEVHCVTNFKNVMEDFREYEPQLVLLHIAGENVSFPFHAHGRDLHGRAPCAR